MPLIRWRFAVVALVLVAVAFPAAALGPPTEYGLAGGAAHVLDDERTGLGGLELRFEPFRLPLGRDLPIVPALGLTVDGDGGTYAYVSFRLDAMVALAALRGEPAAATAPERRWRLVGFSGLGHHRVGDGGRDLGGPLEFRSGVELARRLGPRTRLALSYDHLSNAGIYRSNRGTESLVLVWSWAPFNR
ncbi:MAG TPA: acyloxyacyl hydrolase [Thermoanaerobaculia bacterium]|nr:acyloxyacyl hydrolase [Thermoanaerobaculia bacterium]